MTVRPVIALVAALIVAVPVLAQAQKKAAPAQGAPADPVIARVNGEELHRSDFVAVLQTLPPQARQLPIEQIYPRVLNEMVVNKMAAQAGRKAKLAEDPEVKRRIQQAQDQIIADTYVGRYVRANVDDAKVKVRYDTYIKTLKPAEQVNARHILVKTEDEAKAIIAELKNGTDFATLAKDKSTDQDSKAAGGDLGWFTKEEMVPAFADAAFKLQKGQFTETPVKTDFGYHVIKLEDRRQAPPPTFEEAKPQVTQLLERDLVTQKLKELQNSTKIEMFALDGSKLPAPGGSSSGGAPAPAKPGTKAAPAPAPAAPQGPSLLPPEPKD
jgi:peptidyl-prolyl cis-trans isomerase C